MMIRKDILKESLVKEFEIKEPGRLKYFLGNEVAHSKQGIFIFQQKYVTDHTNSSWSESQIWASCWNRT